MADMTMCDITMCQRQNCPSSQSCYRFMARADPCWQAYFAPPFMSIIDGKCDYFIPACSTPQEAA